MPKCIVNGCSHGSRGKTPSPNVVLHVFPRNIDIIKRWLMATGQNFGDLDTYAQRIIEGKKTDSFRICSCHFTEDSYTFQGRRKALKKSATPTLFLWNGSASDECKAVPAKRPRPNKDDHSESLPAQSHQNSTYNSSSKETSAGQSQTKKKTKKLGYSNDPTSAKQNYCKRNASTQTIMENDTDPSYYCSHCASPLTSKTSVASVQTSDLLPSEPASSKTNFVDSEVQSESPSKTANFQDVKMEVEEPENTLSDDNTDTTSSFSDDSDASSLTSNLSVDYSIFVEHDTEEDDEIVQSIEPFDVLNTAKDPVDDHTFLVFESCLDKLLLSSRCGRDPNCHSPIKKLKKYVFGSFLTVKAVCQSGHHFHLWDSQPRKGSIYYGNLLVSASILLSGSDFAKVYAMNKLLKLKQMSPSAFKQYQSNYLFPVINHHWKTEQEKVIKQIAGNPVFLVEDNANIPGCFHQYCAYSLIEGASKKIINFRVEQFSSADTEKQCFKKSLDKLLEKEIQVKSIGTNRKSIRKLVQKDYPGIQHHYNVSHISKCLRNKLSAASKQNNCSQISQWITPTVNHLLWASKTCDGSADLLKKKWESLMHRVATVHKWETAQLFHGCAHENLSVRCKRKWMKCGSTAFNKFRDIVMSARLIRDLNHLSKICHTDELKLYHNNLLLQYWPRTLHCVEDMVVRTQLAVLDHNYSVHRGKAQENFTHVQDPSGALQPKVRKCVFDTASKAFHLVILKDIVTFAEGEVNIERQTLSDRFSDNPSLEQRPIKDEQW